MKKHFKKLIIFLIIAVMAFPAILLTACTTNPEVIIEGIEMEGSPSKTVYFLEEDLDITGFKIRVKYSNGTSKIMDAKKDWIKNFDSETEGTKTLTVKYTEDGEEFTTTTTITVKKREPIKVENGNYAFNSIKLGDIEIDFTDSDTREASIAEFVLENNAELKKELITGEVAGILANKLKEFNLLFDNTTEVVGIIKTCFGEEKFDYEDVSDYSQIVEVLVEGYLEGPYGISAEIGSQGVQNLKNTIKGCLSEITVDNFYSNIIDKVVGMVEEGLIEEYDFINLIINFFKVNIFVEDNNMYIGNIKTTFTTDAFGKITPDLDGVVHNGIVVEDLLEGVLINYNDNKITFSLSKINEGLEVDIYAVYDYAPVSVPGNTYQLKSVFIDNSEELDFENADAGDIENFINDFLAGMDEPEKTAIALALAEKINFFDFRIKIDENRTIGIDIENDGISDLSLGTFTIDELGNITLDLEDAENDYIEFFKGASIVYDVIEDVLKVAKEIEIGGIQFSSTLIYQMN